MNTEIGEEGLTAARPGQLAPTCSITKAPKPTKTPAISPSSTVFHSGMAAFETPIPTICGPIQSRHCQTKNAACVIAQLHRRSMPIQQGSSQASGLVW